MNNPKVTYRHLCKQNKSIPLFSQSWWLDTVCGTSGWDVVLVVKNKEIVAALPFVLSTKFGFRIIAMPVLTQTLGPWINYPDGMSDNAKLSFDKKVMTELVEALPEYDYFHQHFSCLIKNWLPFYWKGFKQSTRYSYVIKPNFTEDQLWANLEKSARKNITKARKNQIEVEEFDDIDLFYQINSKTFQRQELKVPYSKQLVAEIYENAGRQNSVKLMKAYDETGAVHAIAMVVFDASTCYLLLGSSDPELRQSGAEYMLYWELILFAMSENRTFDFEGSMMENIEIRNRSFGAQQQAYFSISKTNSKLYSFLQMLRKRN